MSSLAIDNIGLLVTADPALGEGPLGLVREAALVVEDERIAGVERAGAAADERIDAAGRCVIPGFVDSHTHLVFAGDRADEFAARMAGRPYAASGIRVTTEATRAASEEELRDLAAARRAEAARAGITHLEIKSGYGLEPEAERRCCAVAAELTDDVTFLGAHAVPPEYDGQADAYVELVCGKMLDACRPYARWIDVFCEDGAFDADQSRAVLEAGRDAGLGLRVHGNQLGLGPGVQLAVEMGAASVDHCTYLSDDDIAALAASDTVATFLPATDFSTRQPYPNARRAIDAGVEVAIADQLQSRLQLHHLYGVLHCAGCPRHAHDARGGTTGRDARRRPRTTARRRGPAGARRPRGRRDPRSPFLHASGLSPWGAASSHDAKRGARGSALKRDCRY